MTCFILLKEHYDFTERIAVYTKTAMEKEKLSWLNAAKVQNQANINQYEKQIQEKEEKKKEFVESNDRLLEEAKNAKENGDMPKSKALNKERKRLQKYIDDITWEINRLENKISALKILTDSEMIKSYMSHMDYCFEEMELFE